VSNKSKKLCISQPPSWVEAWERYAAASGQTLSYWIAEACNAKLPKTAARKLPPRSKPGAPKQ